MIDIIKQYSREALTMLRVAGLYAAQIATAAWTWAMVNPMIASLITSVAIVAFGLYYLRHKTEKGSKRERVENTSTDYSTIIAGLKTEIAALRKDLGFIYEEIFNTQDMIQPSAQGLDARIVAFDPKSTKEYLEMCGIYHKQSYDTSEYTLGYWIENKGFEEFLSIETSPRPNISTTAHQAGGQYELSYNLVSQFLGKAHISLTPDSPLWHEIMGPIIRQEEFEEDLGHACKSVATHYRDLEKGGADIDRNPALSITLKSFWMTVQSLATQPITFFRLVGDDRDWKMLAYRMRSYINGNSTQLAEIANLMKSCLAQFKPNEPEYEMAQVIRNAATEKKFHEGKGDLQGMVSTEHEGAKFEMIDHYLDSVEPLPDQLTARQQSQPS